MADAPRGGGAVAGEDDPAHAPAGTGAVAPFASFRAAAESEDVTALATDPENALVFVGDSAGHVRVFDVVERARGERGGGDRTGSGGRADGGGAGDAAPGRTIPRGAVARAGGDGRRL